MKPEIRRQVAIPSQYPYLQIVSDVSTKASKCQICQTQIPKGEPRVYLLFKRSWRKHPEKQFMHASCLAELCEGQSTVVKCWDCENVCSDKTMKIALVSGKTYQYQTICELCAMSPRYRYCQHCTSLFPKHYVSRAIEFPVDSVWRPNYYTWLCDSCATEHKCDTINTVKASSKENAWLNEQYLKIMTNIADGDMFGDSNGEE